MWILVLAAIAAPTVSAPLESPRHAVEAFLDDVHHGRDAGRYLELRPGERSRGAELARQLGEVIDDRVDLDLGGLSDSPDGDASDGLHADRDVVGRVGDAETGEPIEMVRVTTGPAPRWVFAHATVAKIGAWYAKIDRPWIERWMPPALLAVGPGGLLRWQWIALPLLFGVALALGWLVGCGTRRALCRLAVRTRTTIDDHLLAHMRGPIIFAWTMLFWWVGTTQLLYLTAGGASTVHAITRLLMFYGFFWVLVRMVDMGIDLLRRTEWASLHGLSRSLLPLTARVGKVVVVVVAVVSILSELGYPVASILAGLGVGGIAVALAAQKTVENLFGAFALGVDQPFREGDTIKMDGLVTGTVERIGLRSTRLRTPDRSILSIPNGKLADARIESLAAVDRVRLETTLRLHVATTPDSMRRVLDGLQGLLAQQTRRPVGAPSVHFVGITDHSLDVLVVAWFDSRDGEDLAAIRDAFLLGCLDTVARAGTTLAGGPAPVVDPERPRPPAVT
jgi:MscS family membrane protein